MVSHDLPRGQADSIFFLSIANVRGLSSTLDGDGGIAAPKNIVHYKKVEIRKRSH